MNGDEERPKIPWGTASLTRGFTGIIREAKIQKSERVFKDERTGEDKEPKDQLVLTIEPTSFEAPEERWPRSYYSISNSRRSKWAALQEALEKCGALPKESEEELVGLEFEFERKDLEFGKRRDGTKIVVEDAILPARFIRDTKKKGGAKASAPTPAPTPAQAPAQAPAPAKEEEVDVESLILDAAEKEPINLDNFITDICKKYKLRRAEVFKKAMDLKKKGIVKLSEDGILTVAD